LSHLDLEFVSDLELRISCFYKLPSTLVENIRQIDFFLQNKPNFPCFSTENACLAKKQTQFKPNSERNASPEIVPEVRSRTG